MPAHRGIYDSANIQLSSRLINTMLEPYSLVDQHIAANAKRAHDEEESPEIRAYAIKYTSHTNLMQGKSYVAAMVVR